MKTMRIGCFETNSSSLHAFITASADEWERFKSGQENISMEAIDLIKPQGEDGWTRFVSFSEVSYDAEREWKEDCISFDIVSHEFSAQMNGIYSFEVRDAADGGKVVETLISY